MLIDIILIIVGFILLIKGADFLVDGATGIAKKFKISEMIIGLTIVAMGTSMPEFMVSVTSALEGHSDLALGNVVGSNLANILLILGICALISNILVPKDSRHIECPLCLIITAILLAVCMNGGTTKVINQFEGIVLLLIFVLFLIYIFFNSKKKTKGIREELKSDKEVVVDTSIKTLIINCLKILIGVLGLKFGADFVTNNSVNIATILGVSEKIIAVTIVAIGTSLPELVASVTAIRKGENDIAVGNIIGSCVFNILLVLGLSSLITPINYSISYNFDIILLICVVVLLIVTPYIGKNRHFIEKWEGILFLIIYFVYMIILIFIR